MSCHHVKIVTQNFSGNSVSASSTPSASSFAETLNSLVSSSPASHDATNAARLSSVNSSASAQGQETEREDRGEKRHGETYAHEQTKGERGYLWRSRATWHVCSVRINALLLTVVQSIYCSGEGTFFKRKYQTTNRGNSTFSDYFPLISRSKSWSKYRKYLPPTGSFIIRA